jgi:CHAT domain-containing protein/Tfp pilus assembly protein PilF
MIKKAFTSFLTILLFLGGSLSYTHPDQKQDLMDEYNTILVLMGKRDYETAIKGFKEIIRKDQTFHRAYMKIVDAYLGLKKPEEGIEFFKNLIKGNPSQAYSHLGLAYIYEKTKQYKKAIGEYKKVIELNPDISEAYYGFVDSSFRVKGEKEKQELKSFLEEQIKKNPENACLYYGLGLYHLLNREWEKSLALMDRVIKLDPDFWRAYLSMATINYRMSKFQQVIPLLNRVLKLARKMKDLELEALIYGNSAVIHRNLGNPLKALDSNQQALEINREIGKIDKEAECLGNIGVIHSNLGSYEKALRYISKSLAIVKKTGNQRSEGTNLQNLGAVYSSLGDYQKALLYFGKVQAINKKSGDIRSEGITLSNIGYIHMLLGNYSRAQAYFEQALAIHRKTNNKKSEGITLSNIGKLQGELGNFAQAQKWYKKALAVINATGNKKHEGIVLNCLGNVNMDLKEYEKSLDYLNQALVIGKKIMEPQILWGALKSRASLKRIKKRCDAAYSDLKKAINIIESARGQLNVQEQKAHFLAKNIEIYEDMVDLLFEIHKKKPNQGYDKECVYYIEKAKARAFLDSLQEGRIDLKKYLSPELKKREIEITREISSVQTDLVKPNVPEEKRKELKDKLENLEEQYQNLVLRIKMENPRYARTVYPEPYGVEDIQKELLTEKTALIEYFSGKDEAFVACITKNDIFIQKIPDTRTLLKRIKNYIKLLSKHSAKKFYGTAAGRKIYQDLLGPVEHKLKNIEQLIIIPDNVIHYLPFESLIISGKKNRNRYLVEKYQISNAPSASSLINLLSRKRGTTWERDFLAFADPVYNLTGTSRKEITDTQILREFSIKKGFEFHRLPFSKTEVNQISKHFPPERSNVYLREMAKEENIKKLELDKYKIVHFATHGFLDEKVPSRSSLILTLDDDPKEDGFFQVREIYNTRFNSNLVVLSACNTGRGSLENGEGVTGLYRAFLNSGAQSIVMSLWNINDKATSEFMDYFYKYLGKGNSKVEALQKAKLKMIKSKFNHPFYWAAFVLNGESTSNL